jgi:hypothetical protein
LQLFRKHGGYTDAAETSEIGARQPPPGERRPPVVEEAAKTAISFIPVVGPFIEKAVTAVEVGAAKLSESRAGVAALMKAPRAVAQSA